MLKKVFLLVVVMFVVVFSINKVNTSKTVVTSNYLVLKSIEHQNLKELTRAVQFSVPSFSVNMLHTNKHPYTNEDGDKVVTIESTVKEGVIDPKVKGVNNNYLFNTLLEYNNTSKKITIIDNINSEGNVVNKEYYLNEKPVYLLMLE